MPLIRRLPKRGFNNAAFHKHYAIVNLEQLNVFKAGSVVNEQMLRESNLVRGHFAGIKILGDGELKHELIVEADKVSAGARTKIEKAGGTINLREGRRVEKLDVEAAATEAPTAPKSKKKSTKKPLAKVKSRQKKKS